MVTSPKTKPVSISMNAMTLAITTVALELFVLIKFLMLLPTWSFVIVNQVLKRKKPLPLNVKTLTNVILSIKPKLSMAVTSSPTLPVTI
jgi:hypothetical protein